MARKTKRSARERSQQRQSQQRRRRIIIGAIVVIIVAGLAALIIYRQQPADPEDVALPESLSPPPEADGSAWGPAGAPVLIEEFSDFQ
jgi:flagellar biosynthesis/type III secretory pathway M-ring protein FliF/YscJ